MEIIVQGISRTVRVIQNETVYFQPSTAIIVRVVEDKFLGHAAREAEFQTNGLALAKLGSVLFELDLKDQPGRILRSLLVVLADKRVRFVVPRLLAAK